MSATSGRRAHWAWSLPSTARATSHSPGRPAGPTVLSKSLTVAGAGLLSIALLATLAGLHLGIGDRPTAVMSVLTGSLIGMFWVRILLSAASELRTYSANPWSVMVGAWLFAPLYLLITLGMIGTGPLSRLAYYSLQIDNVLSGWDRAMQAGACRRLALEPTASKSDGPVEMADGDATPQPGGRRRPVSPPSMADARTAEHTGHPAAATTATTADDGPAPVPPCAERAPDTAVEPQYPGSGAGPRHAVRPGPVRSTGRRGGQSHGSESRPAIPECRPVIGPTGASASARPQPVARSCRSGFPVVSTSWAR